MTTNPKIIMGKRLLLTSEDSVHHYQRYNMRQAAPSTDRSMDTYIRLDNMGAVSHQQITIIASICVLISFHWRKKS
jgi:hypothetical protein